jgi:hypothetical protein
VRDHLSIRDRYCNESRDHYCQSVYCVATGANGVRGIANGRPCQLHVLQRTLGQEEVISRLAISSLLLAFLILPSHVG